MMFEVVSFAMLALGIGIRHGFDTDHIAAIADMVGAENQRVKQVRLGVMYALGHGSIVFVIGLLALYLGTHFSEETVMLMESLVGISLVILGGLIIYSVFKQKSEYEYKSRFQIIYETVARFFNKDHQVKKLSSTSIGIIGALIIGVIHGIGVESPTQIAIITSSVGLDNYSASMIQLVLFVIGLLISTIFITFAASWGFMKAQLKRKIYIFLGSVTGVYSVVLGCQIILGV